MSEQQFKALMAYIDARIDEKIMDAFGRDSLYEAIKTSDYLKELREALLLDVSND